MKLCIVRHASGLRTGVVRDDEVVLLPPQAPSVDDAVRSREALAAIEDHARRGEVCALGDVELAAPLQRFNRDILCSGWNYWDHYEESQGKREGQDPAARPEHPTFFTKGPGTVIGPADNIAYDPAISGKWDYEAELALVIGRAARNVDPEEALGHVAGYLVANDVSQRDLQRAHGGQWLKGKSIDATMPIGPWVTTSDEVENPHELQISCELNGEILQDASTRQMAFGLGDLIAELSFGMTLHPGDVLLTGTPSGIGNAREPQIFLRDGDFLVTRVSGLGELHNRVGHMTAGAGA
ncbi:fumarylacetoacetate hydrolase family protein [Actinomadura sp. 3N407]|uniref:fumarylacetoacetate hydrolase family protein n=1 Tax=Actinomadura sp. 3N407 TaxID=3457423 RepID=UPI003FCC3F36